MGDAFAEAYAAAGGRPRVDRWFWDLLRSLHALRNLHCYRESYLDLSLQLSLARMDAALRIRSARARRRAGSDRHLAPRPRGLLARSRGPSFDP